MTNHNELLDQQQRDWVWPVHLLPRLTTALPRPEVSHRIDYHGRLRIVLDWDGDVIEMFDDAAATLARCILDELEGADLDAR